MTERTDSGVALRQAVTEPVHPKKRRGMSEGAEVGGARCGGLQGGVRGRVTAIFSIIFVNIFVILWQDCRGSLDKCY